MSREPFNVGTLKAALADLPDDLPIYVSSDPEGNSYDTLWDVERRWVADYGGQEFWPVHPEDLAERGTTDGLTDAVVMWP